jgi:hypothetical protein
MTFAAYLVAFAVDLWVTLHGVAPGRHRRGEIEATAAEVADTTDAEPLEALELLGIAAWESGYDASARGRAGERGRWQVMPPASSYGAREALSRLRRQGIAGFMGFTRCGELCDAMAERRTLPAKVYLWSHDPPSRARPELATVGP